MIIIKIDDSKQRTNYIDYLKSNQENIINDIRSLVEIPSIRDESTTDINQPFGIEIRNAFDKLYSNSKRQRFCCKRLLMDM